MSVEIKFDDVFVSELKGHQPEENTPQEVLNAFYSNVKPTAVSQPRLLIASNSVAQLLDISFADLRSDYFLQALAGNHTEFNSFASCYGGHQFGHWAGQLGDGRAITLGDKFNAKKQLWELQLKGAGVTPYSRRGDGRAVLRSSIREFICSEAMHYLNVPTTRALSLVESGDKIIRDMFYDGRAAYEPGAVVARVAPSFVRFGNFELFASRGDTESVQQLADFMIQFHFSDIENNESLKNKYATWFEEICRRTAQLMVEWMRVGFVHGVMNTDNMSVLGLTIDFGPFAWLDDFNPSFTPNTSDKEGRYAYTKQASIAHWNLAMLGHALSSLMTQEDIKQCLSVYVEVFNRQYHAMLCGKLGLSDTQTNSKDVFSFVDHVFDFLSHQESDFTLFFKKLESFRAGTVFSNLKDASKEQIAQPFADVFYQQEALDEQTLEKLQNLMREYASLVENDALSLDDALEVMHRSNPWVIPRNYLLQEAIEAAENNDVSVLEALYAVIQNPYDLPKNEKYTQKRPQWAKHKAGCSALSCSS